MKRENWMRWDIDSETDVKTQWFLSRFKDKARALGFFLHVVSRLYQTTDGYIDLDDVFIEGTAAYLGWEKDEVNEALSGLCRARLFFADTCSGKSRLTSFRVQSELLHRKKISISRSEAGKIGAVKSNTYRQMLGKFRQRSADKSRLDKSRLDIDKKKNKAHTTHEQQPSNEQPQPEYNAVRNGSVTAADLNYPMLLNSNKVRQMTQLWLDHKKSLRKPYKSAASVELLLGRWVDKGERAFVEAVEYSISNNYQGLFSPADRVNFTPKKTNTELQIDDHKKLLEKIRLQEAHE